MRLWARLSGCATRAGMLNGWRCSLASVSGISGGEVYVCAFPLGNCANSRKRDNTLWTPVVVYFPGGRGPYSS